MDLRTRLTKGLLANDARAINELQALVTYNVAKAYPQGSHEDRADAICEAYKLLYDDIRRLGKIRSITYAAKSAANTIRLMRSPLGTLHSQLTYGAVKSDSEEVLQHLSSSDDGFTENSLHALLVAISSTKYSKAQQRMLLAMLRGDKISRQAKYEMLKIIGPKLLDSMRRYRDLDHVAHIGAKYSNKPIIDGETYNTIPFEKLAEAVAKNKSIMLRGAD